MITSLSNLALDRQKKSRLLALAAQRRKSGDAKVTQDPDALYGPPSALYKPQPKQLEIERQLRKGKRHNLLVGGSRSGKTFELVKHVVRRALIAPGSRHAILRLRGNAVKSSIRLDTLPKVCRLVYPRMTFKPHDQDGYLTFPGDSEIWYGGLDDKERVEKILGNEFSTIILNECSQIPYASVLIARTRLAQVVRDYRGRTLVQQELCDLNPVGKSHWSHREFIQKIDPESRKPLHDPDEHFFSFLQPSDNAANLDPAYIESLKYAPERTRRRFYDGQYVDDVEGALWTIEALENARITLEDLPETMDRLVIGIDPSGTNGDEETRSDDVGIVACGREGTGDKSKAYLLEDGSCNEPPLVWAQRAIAMYLKWGADRIVAERNFGGEMVRAVIDAAARSMNVVLPSVELVTASRGKAVRAEPISVLCGHQLSGAWVSDRVRHVGEFPLLEEELLNFSVYGYLGPKSPNRADAYVWAMTDMMLGGEQVPSLWSRNDLEVVE